MACSIAPAHCHAKRAPRGRWLHDVDFSQVYNGIWQHEGAIGELRLAAVMALR